VTPATKKMQADFLKMPFFKAATSQTQAVRRKHYSVSSRNFVKTNRMQKCLKRLCRSDCYLWSTGLFKMIVGLLTTCHTQYTWDRII